MLTILVLSCIFLIFFDFLTEQARNKDEEAEWLSMIRAAKDTMAAPVDAAAAADGNGSAGNAVAPPAGNDDVYDPPTEPLDSASVTASSADASADVSAEVPPAAVHAADHPIVVVVDTPAEQVSAAVTDDATSQPSPAPGPAPAPVASRDRDDGAGEGTGTGGDLALSHDALAAHNRERGGRDRREFDDTGSLSGFSMSSEGGGGRSARRRRQSDVSAYSRLDSSIGSMADSVAREPPSTIRLGVGLGMSVAMGLAVLPTGAMMVTREAEAAATWMAARRSGRETEGRASKEHRTDGLEALAEAEAEAEVDLQDGDANPEPAPVAAAQGMAGTPRGESRGNGKDRSLRFSQAVVERRSGSARFHRRASAQGRSARQQRSFRDVLVVSGLGTIAMQGAGLTSFEGLGVQADLTVLYLQRNRFSSFRHLAPQPVLAELCLDENAITSFAFAVRQPHLRTLTLWGNPVCNHRNYRIMCLLAFGSQLRHVDGEILTSMERKRARALPPEARRLVAAGWLLDDKPRGRSEWAALEASVLRGEESHYMHRLDQDDGNGGGGGGGGAVDPPGSAGRVPALESVSSPGPRRWRRSGGGADGSGGVGGVGGAGSSAPDGEVLAVAAPARVKSFQTVEWCVRNTYVMFDASRGLLLWGVVCGGDFDVCLSVAAGA